jgi:hypothetical protein
MITVCGTPRRSAQTGALAAATSADRDDTRASTAVASHVRQQAMPTGHASASQTPRKVATPLPPRNPSQTG